VGKAAAAKKLASAAAYGGGGLSLLGGAVYGVLTAEAKLARRAIGDTNGEPPDSTGWYGRGRPGPAIKVALLGDSSAAGYGVDRVEDTPGARLASGLAEWAPISAQSVQQLLAPTATSESVGAYGAKHQCAFWN